MREIVHNVYRQFPFYYFTEEKAQETWMEMDGETLAEIEKRNGAYLEEVAENERNLREENAKKSKEANLEKNSSVSEESKKINNTDKIENKDNSEMSEIIENSENHLNSETQPANTLPQSNIVLPHPILDLSRDKLSDYDYLMNNFYIVDSSSSTVSCRRSITANSPPKGGFRPKSRAWRSNRATWSARTSCSARRPAKSTAADRRSINCWNRCPTASI